jgi:hypothetical protein
LNAQADVMIVLYTEQETSALLDVFAQNNTWGATRQKHWHGCAQNFARYKPIIQCCTHLQRVPGGAARVP